VLPLITSTILFFCMAIGYNPKPMKDDCSHLCGNITVPFPFGLEEIRSARRLFQLNCSDPAHSVLQYNDLFRVTNINVTEGLVGIKINSSLVDGEFSMVLKMMTYSKEPDLFVDPLESASFQWAVANLTCQQAKQNASGYVGYRCKCSTGFERNPYIEHDCHGNLSLPVIFSLCSRRSSLPAQGRR